MSGIVSKKAVLSQGNRAMPQLFFQFKVIHSIRDKVILNINVGLVTFRRCSAGDFSSKKDPQFADPQNY